ncbi:VTT domain-containing protein [Alicyclobacillus fastidiosus]|uniref:TVP38/TMEM64 family membrane protein n=1 Tax=Alicyclobacillus fastidiosus TaxID=392011 RepID=A0ABY6ZMN7_9BACL|nr:VTT domain-containing protein [Alicyclobacillus fastidiosus]WAH44198.1 VTT domain-containing protein [Alicyclobacillus fastidiosus]GMA60514.1 TVP38/TMEM64 family protein [Alicyclobacillus fastidiosus]
MASQIRRFLTDWRTMSMIVIGVAMVGTVLYLDRHHKVSQLIRSWGAFGIIIAIVLMLIWCLTPIPSEGLLVIFLRVYGVGWGTAYAYLGSTLSALIIFFIARHFTKIWLSRATSHERFEQVNRWVKDWGSLGLLVARLLPVPAFVVNYVAGMVPAVNLWNYLWTAVVAIFPYYLGVALVFQGVSGNWIYILIGVIPLAVVGFVGLLIRRRAQRNVEMHRRFSR